MNGLALDSGEFISADELNARWLPRKATEEEMSKLTDEQIDNLYINGTKHWIGKREIARAIEAVVTEPLIQRIAELERLLEEAQKDAERYRWLRSDDIEVPHGQREICVMLMRLPFREDQTDETLIESELDAAIDAAMQKGQS